MKKALIFIFLCSRSLISVAFNQKCLGPFDPKAMHKIAVPFPDGTYDYSYDKFEKGKKYTCFVQVKNTEDAIDFVASHPNKETFEWLKRYLKKRQD